MSSPAKVSFSPSKFVANSMCMVATCLNQLPYCGTRGTVLAKSGICVDNTVLQGVIKKGSNNRISNKMRPKTPFSCCRNRAKKVYTSSGGTAIGTLVSSAFPDYGCVSCSIWLSLASGSGTALTHSLYSCSGQTMQQR